MKYFEGFFDEKYDFDLDSVYTKDILQSNKLYSRKKKPWKENKIK